MKKFPVESNWTTASYTRSYRDSKNSDREFLGDIDDKKFRNYYWCGLLVLPVSKIPLQEVGWHACAPARALWQTPSLLLSSERSPIMSFWTRHSLIPRTLLWRLLPWHSCVVRKWSTSSSLWTLWKARPSDLGVWSEALNQWLGCNSLSRRALWNILSEMQMRHSTSTHFFFARLKINIHFFIIFSHLWEAG